VLLGLSDDLERSRLRVRFDGARARIDVRQRLLHLGLPAHVLLEPRAQDAQLDLELGGAFCRVLDLRLEAIHGGPPVGGHQVHVGWAVAAEEGPAERDVVERLCHRLSQA
jgi:hypothetical protein